MTDWLEDMERIYAFYRNPSANPRNADAVFGFLAHAADHIRAAKRLLLNLDDDPFTESVDRLLRMGRKNPTGDWPPEEQTVKTREIELLEQLLITTKQKHVTWRQRGPDSFECRGCLRVSVDFAYPQLGEGTPCGADVAKLTTENVELTFFSGTAGMRLIQEILAAAFPERRKHLRECDRRVRDAIGKLRAGGGVKKSETPRRSGRAG
jgi:hypothetical protein